MANPWIRIFLTFSHRPGIAFLQLSSWPTPGNWVMFIWNPLGIMTANNVRVFHESQRQTRLGEAWPFARWTTRPLYSSWQFMCEAAAFTGNSSSSQ